MRQKQYLQFLILLAVNIVAVIFIFKLMEDRKVASLFAGSLFVVLPLYMMRLQFSRVRWQPAHWWAVHLFFFFVFALPILLSRIIFWSSSFDEIFIFGLIPARAMHGYANSAYLLMLLSSAWAWWRKEK